MSSFSENKTPVIAILDLPAVWPERLIQAIPAQRVLINRLLAEGVVQSYSVSADRTKVWMVLVVEDTPYAIDAILSKFPIIEFVDYTWEPLLFTNDSSSIMQYSLN